MKPVIAAILGAALLLPSALTVAQSSAMPGFNGNLLQLPDEALAGFVQIPAGSFMMGSDPAQDRMAFANERWSQFQRQGNVNEPTFYIQRYEVTVGQYREFVQKTMRAVAAGQLDQPDNHPVTHVTWPDALAYARWLQGQLLDSAQTPMELKSLLQQGWQLTLPSEAQWEKAARGTDNRIFPWGNQLNPNPANLGSTAARPVGAVACATCAYGLADMSGNVWEWTRSPYQAYPYSDADDRDTVNEDALWVIRGGSYVDEINNARAATRGAADPGARREFIGFRLVLMPR